MTTETIHETVRQHYADAAVRASQGSSCCSDPETIGANLYSALERDELPSAAVLASLGCGNPTAVADLHPGERVLDLGSGGGIDVLLSAKRVGPTGRAFGVDMTDEMLALAQANAAQAGATNVEFLKGHIEALPLPAESIDVVISNCVVNLAADKRAVFAEIARVLRPGGRIGISDIVAEDSLSPEQRAERGSFAGCIAGALSVSEFRDGLEAVGLTEVTHHAVPHRHRRDDQRHHQGDEADRCATAHRPCCAARDAPCRGSGRLLRRHRLLLTREVMSRSSIAPRDLAALILAATCWGVGTVISKAALAEISPFTLLPLQLAASLAVLAVLMRSQGISFRTDGSPLLGRLGLLNPGLAYALGLIGLTTITASLYVLLWAFEPLMILFLAAWFLRERITPAFVVLSLVAVAGMLVILYDPSASSGQWIGVGLTLAGIVCCAVYTVVTRRWIPDAKETSQVILSQQAHALLLAIGLVLVVGLAGGQIASTALTPLGLASAIGSGVLYYAGAYWFYLGALRHVPASFAAVSFYLIPIVGVAAGALLLGERLDPRQWIGAVIVLGAILAIIRQPIADSLRQELPAVA